jgi:hypothetical protein
MLEMNKLEYIKRRIQDGLDVYDDEVDFIFNPIFHQYADRHFTSIYIAKLALAFLTEKGASHILDIGSGVGKFCIIAGMMTDLPLTGIEYRELMVNEANKLAQEAELTHVQFIHANILECSFDDYSGFYMFNPFLEQIDETATMSSDLETSISLYRKYHQHVAHQLSLQPAGTPLVTYYVPENTIPSSFVKQKTLLQGTLIFWEKI